MRALLNNPLLFNLGGHTVVVNDLHQPEMTW